MQHRKIIHRSQTGFTIVELLIVIVVIGILAAITIVAYNGVQQRARDTRRQSDVSAIAKAIAIRAVDHDTLIKYGSSCSTGEYGFFNQTGISMTGSDYGTQSAMDCLKTDSNTTATLADPSGATSCAPSNPEGCFVYMFATCSDQTYIYAHLESKPASDHATDDTCQPFYDTAFGMNHYIKI